MDGDDWVYTWPHLAFVCAPLHTRCYCTTSPVQWEYWPVHTYAWDYICPACICVCVRSWSDHVPCVFFTYDLVPPRPCTRSRRLDSNEGGYCSISAQARECNYLLLFIERKLTVAVGGWNETWLSVKEVLSEDVSFGERILRFDKCRTYFFSFK